MSLRLLVRKTHLKVKAHVKVKGCVSVTSLHDPRTGLTARQSSGSSVGLARTRKQDYESQRSTSRSRIPPQRISVFRGDVAGKTSNLSRDIRHGDASIFKRVFLFRITGNCRKALSVRSSDYAARVCVRIIILIVIIIIYVFRSGRGDKHSLCAPRRRDRGGYESRSCDLLTSVLMEPRECTYFHSAA